MFHRAISIAFREGTVFELTFEDGTVKRFDMAVLFSGYPQLTALKDRSLFESGRLMGAYGIVWNDELDLEAETVYQEGETVRIDKAPTGLMVGRAVAAARARAGISQKELSAISGIDQSDISRIERGLANPAVSTLERIAAALGAKLSIAFV